MTVVGQQKAPAETEPGRQALCQGWFSKERIWFLRKRRKKIIKYIYILER